MSKELTKEEHDALVATQRHKEIYEALRRIAASMSVKEDEALMISIGKQIQSLDRLISVIGSPTRSETIIPYNDEHVVNSIRSMADLVANKLEQLRISIEQRPKEWRFEFKRNSAGFIQSPVIIKTQ